jgi:hypothetical protein
VAVNSEVKFWYHKWYGLIALKNIFPNLFEMEAHKKCSIAERIKKRDDGEMTFLWRWKQSASISSLDLEIKELEDLLRTYKFEANIDK